MKSSRPLNLKSHKSEEFPLPSPQKHQSEPRWMQLIGIEGHLRVDGVGGLGSPLAMRPNPPFAQLVPLSAPLGGDENWFKGKKLNATSTSGSSTQPKEDVHPRAGT